MLKPSAENDEVYAVAEPPRDNVGALHDEIDRRRVRRILADTHKEIHQRRKDAPAWRLETHWDQFLEYPLRAWPMVLVLAVAWASLSAGLLLLLPDTWTPIEVLARFPLLLFVFLLVGYSAACLQTTLAAGRKGQTSRIVWPELGLAQTVRCGAQVVVCFLAGPVVPAAVVFYFWLNSGDLLWVDWAIVWELGMLTVGYWTLTLLAVEDRGRFRDANPTAVGRLVHRLGYRAWVVALLAVVVVGHGLLALDALAELHRGVNGWLLLVGCLSMQFFWMVLLLRWLGASRYRAGKRVSG
jgi:hypothetical protein